VALGTIVDVGVWHYVKDLKIFDDEDEKTSENNRKSDENLTKY
jgi:hypothetical protein